MDWFALIALSTLKYDLSHIKTKMWGKPVIFFNKWGQKGWG